MNGAPKVVVLDDDPTGTQTVHGVPVLTGWDVDTLKAELESDLPGFFVLTNTRAMGEDQARAVNAQVGLNLRAAQQETGQPFVVVSRSDSTLRGHFPAEVEALAQTLGLADAPILLCPYFEAGGRVTINDVHYVREGEGLTPVGETEFARDATFGYAASDLKQWVEEKTGGRTRASEVQSVGLEDIRAGGVNAVSEHLLALPPRSVCVLNCERPGDLTVLAAAARRAEARGRDFLYRTAAGFASARIGIAPSPLLRAADLPVPATVAAPRAGTLIVVGSYVEKSTAQLHTLLATGNVVSVELAVDALFSETSRDLEIGQAARAVETALAKGQDVAVYTSRERVRAGHLETGGRISQALVEVVRHIQTRPGCVVAKGGITSSDLATDALGIRRAMVLGQIAPGVPVWQAGEESRWPDLAYIVFPGNVGNVETLADVCRLLPD